MRFDLARVPILKKILADLLTLCIQYDIMNIFIIFTMGTICLHVCCSAEIFTIFPAESPFYALGPNFKKRSHNSNIGYFTIMV